MFITFKDLTVKKLCEDLDHSSKILGEAIADKLFCAISQLRSLEHIDQLNMYKSIDCVCVENENSVIYTIDLTEGKYLLLVPVIETPEFENKITSIMISEVLN